MESSFKRMRDNNILPEEEELKALDHLILVGPKAAISKAVKKLGVCEGYRN